MSEECLVTLCIPTNGIIEWVVPVLDSIYCQNEISEDIFEVVVTNNGNNTEFERMMHEYEQQHRNLIYRKTTAQSFLNQIEAFKLAKGQFIKFVNHRSKLLPGTLNYFLKYVRDYINTKPVSYFSNGALRLPHNTNAYDSFDKFIAALSYYSSWSAGISVWKKHFFDLDLKKQFDVFFPHTNILFSKRHCNEYIVDNTILFEDIPADVTKKGKYDLFQAFAVDYIQLLEQLYKDGDITQKTFKKIKSANRWFLANLYFTYVVLQRSCSYDLSGYKKAIGVYYSDFGMKIRVPFVVMRMVAGMVVRKIKG